MLMGETFTFLKAVDNQSEEDKMSTRENLSADDVLFYHSLRADLELLEKKPKLQTIHYLLDYSRSLR